MIQIQELRIGNLVNYTWLNNDGVIGKTVELLGAHNIVLVENYYNKSLAANIHCDISPIALTEEWLLKMGLDRGKQIETFKDKTFSVQWNDVNKWYAFYHNIDSKDMLKSDIVCLRDNLQYVHEVQNLFHAICGKELEVKL